MSGNRDSLGTISRGDSTRRRRKRRDDTIRMILAVVLVCVLVMVVGFLGVNALRGNGDKDDKNQTNSGEDILQNGTNGETDGDTSGEATGLETTEATEEQTQPENTYVPETVTKEHIVWLDAGHGGIDSGTLNSDKTILEKDINLAITHKIRELLESSGAHVILTREDDSSLYIEEGKKTTRQKYNENLKNRKDLQINSCN